MHFEIIVLSIVSRGNLWRRGASTQAQHVAMLLL